MKTQFEYLDEPLRRSARIAPESPALTLGSTTRTYAELDRAAEALLAQLKALGVGPGRRVAVCLPKSPAAVVAFQAVLRSGAAYVPLEPAEPFARLERVLDDCSPAAVVCEPEFAGKAPLSDGVVSMILCPTIDGESFEIAGAEARRPATSTATLTAGETITRRVDDPAYVLYTSGSSGTPRGVVVSHGAALSFIEWAGELLSVGSRDVLANHASLQFDLSVFDLYVAFAAGARVVLIPPDAVYAPVALAELIRHEAVTIWYSVPSALMLLMEAGELLRKVESYELREIIFAGEVFPGPELRRLWAGFRGRARLWNFYGPTETNVCTYHEVRETLDPLPIGKPVTGFAAWIAAPEPATPGPGRSTLSMTTPPNADEVEEGELVVAGPGVMRGYLNGPAAPATDASGATDPRPSRLHRTGDRVRRVPDGGFLFLGRLDEMLKIRGRRVEPGEIEAALKSHPGVREAAVVGMGEKGGPPTGLAAGIVPYPDAEAVDLLSVKRHLSERLPPYMNVDRLHLLDSLPRNRNGKLDRPALARMFES